jgi:phosphatidate cytidylyltransferase
MLRWRLIVGTLSIAAIVALAWLDYRAAIPGTWLGPAILVLAILASRELLDLYAVGGLRPIALTVYLGTLLVLASPWFPLVGRMLAGSGSHGAPGAEAAARSVIAGGEWTLAAMAIAVLVAFAGEMARYREPGRVTANLAAAVFAVAYLGLLPSFAIRLRLEWGIGAFASLVIVVKMGDTGAYLFGKLFGRRKMAPVLSPNKTIEGAFGAICFSLLGAWAAAFSVVPWAAPHGVSRTTVLPPFWGWTLFAVLVGGAGMFGDLAESLLKRDGGSKNSSTWMPGLGGVLDLLDSVLIAAPVAYFLWAIGVVGT